MKLNTAIEQKVPTYILRRPEPLFVKKFWYFYDSTVKFNIIYINSWPASIFYHSICTVIPERVSNKFSQSIRSAIIVPSKKKKVLGPGVAFAYR